MNARMRLSDARRATAAIEPLCHSEGDSRLGFDGTVWCGDKDGVYIRNNQMKNMVIVRVNGNVDIDGEFSVGLDINKWLSESTMDGTLVIQENVNTVLANILDTEGRPFTSSSGLLARNIFPKVSPSIKRGIQKELQRFNGCLSVEVSSLDFAGALLNVHPSWGKKFMGTVGVCISKHCLRITGTKSGCLENVPCNNTTGKIFPEVRFDLGTLTKMIGAASTFPGDTVLIGRNPGDHHIFFTSLQEEFKFYGMVLSEAV